ncbi:MAG: type II toxin-antitoxin system HicA family toxin [Gemmatimonadota bacterium]|nr:type II toxin-antitoxin system HicA family toxin [Gemmatimonadota bacterium]
MKIPRDLSGEQVVQLLSRNFGYRVRRTRGSHATVTLTTTTKEHSVTIPLHRPVRIGTLSRIISDVATFVGVSKDEIVGKLFGP